MSCDIEGVIIRPLARHNDERGWLTELFRCDEIPAEYHPMMCYISMTRPGMTRGPHEHREQTDLFCFLGPSAFRLHLWDNRLKSSTYGQKCIVEATVEKRLMVIIPPGIVHGYANVGDCDGLVFNAPNRLFMGENRCEPVDEIRYEDDPESHFRLDPSD